MPPAKVVIVDLSLSKLSLDSSPSIFDVPVSDLPNQDRSAIFEPRDSQSNRTGFDACEWPCVLASLKADTPATASQAATVSAIRNLQCSCFFRWKFNQRWRSSIPKHPVFFAVVCPFSHNRTSAVLALD